MKELFAKLFGVKRAETPVLVYLGEKRDFDGASVLSKNRPERISARAFALNETCARRTEKNARYIERGLKESSEDAYLSRFFKKAVSFK